MNPVNNCPHGSRSSRVQYPFSQGFKPGRLFLRNVQPLKVFFGKVSGLGTFLLAVLLCFGGGFSHAEDIGFTNTIAHSRSFITDVMAEHGIPGCSVVLVEGRRVAWAEGFGYANVEEQIPVTTDTVMMIGSVSKFLTAIMAAQLVDEGALDLDAPVTNHIPELTMQPRFEGTPDAWTARNLLNHHSGLPGDAYNGLFGLTEYWPGYATWLLEYLPEDYPLYPPDLMASYCNNGFAIMGEAIARLDGVDYTDAAETRIFAPLGMTHSSFLPDKPTVADHLATGYQGGEPQPTLICNTPASGGALSRPLDMAQVIKMVLADGEVDGEVFLSQERIADIGREADAPVKPGNLFRPGLGLDSVADPVMLYAGDAWMKSGETGTFSSLLLILPECQMGVFVNINITHPAAFLIARTILMAAILERDGLDFPGIAPMPNPAPVTRTVEELQPLEGHYITGGQVIHFSAEVDGTLAMTYDAQRQDEPSEHWHPHENDRFFPLGQTDVQYAFTNMAGRDVVLRYGSDGNMHVEMTYGGYFEGILGERYDPPPVPAAWSNRLDRVWLADNMWHDDWLYKEELQTIELSKGNGILALSGVASAVLEPDSDDIAFVGGMSTRGGGAVRSESHPAGHEVLWYAGYRFRALDDLPVLQDAVSLAGSVGPHDNALFVYEPEIAGKEVVFMLSQDAGNAIIALFNEDLERVQDGQGLVEYAATTDEPVVLSVSSPEPLDFEIKAVDVTKVREAMRRTLLRYPYVPGFGITAQEPGFPSVTLTEGYARVSPPSEGPSLPLQGDEQFHIASISKTYTAAAIFLLQQRGLLDITNSVTNYAPELNIPRAEEITIEMLLQHRSGLPVANDWFNRKLIENPLMEFTVDEIVNVANWHYPNLMFEPGTAWSYTDTGYNILARIIENVSGTSYQDFLENEVLLPLGLTNTFAPPNDQIEVPEPSVSSYMLIRSGFQDRSTWNPSVEFGCGSMIATLEDLTDMTHAFFMTTNLLDEDTHALMMEEVSPGFDVYGRGCNLAEGLGWGHDGTMWGTISTARVDTNNGVRVAAVMNGQYEDERLTASSFAIRSTLGLLKNALGYDAGLFGQQPPMVYPILGPARQGKSFRYQPLSSNFPTDWTVTGMPDGMDFDPSTGEISGTPSEQGTFPLTLTAQNAYGQAEVELDLEVQTGYTNTIAVIREKIQDMMEDEGAVGLSIALVDDQDIVWAEGFGYADREAEIPVTPDTVFRVGSISKAFTAAAALQYAERGLLDIYASFVNYVPEASWRPRYEEARPITSFDLMTHHSGLPGDIIRAGSLTHPAGKGYLETLSDLAQTYPSLEPGTMNNYCNVGFVLLEGVIEAAAAAEGDHRSFAQLANDRLFEPLGMEATSYLFDKPLIINRLATPYVGGQRMPPEFIEALGAGGMYSRPTDLAEFIKAAFASYPRVLRKETLDLAMTDHSTNATFDAFLSQKTGLGWDDVADRRMSYAGPSVSKAGDTMAYAAQLHLLPEKKLGVAISVNSPSSIPTTLDALVLQHALLERDGVHWPTDTITYPTDLAAISQVELEELAGTYAGPADYDLVEAHHGSLTYRRAVSYGAMTLENLRLRENGWFMSDADPSQLIAFANVDGRNIVLHRQNHGTYETHSIFSERFEPTELTDAWSNRLGKTWTACNAPENDYLAVLGVPLELTLEHDHRGVLRVVTGGIPPIRALRPETDELAWIPGMINRNDSAVQIVDINGVEHLLYGGYLYGRFAGGDGSSENPWEVNTPEQLDNLRYYPDNHFKLIGDITFDESDFEEGGDFYNDGKGWAPFGPGYDDQFTGSFDGQNHTITGLYINRPDTSQVGLFGYLGDDGEVRNVGVVDADVSGDGNVGGLVGDNGGTVSNSYATGNVSGDSDVGGLVGRNHDSVITDSFATGNVYGNSRVGGLVGYNNNGAEISHSFAAGAVIGDAGATGGFIGENNDGAVESSFWDTETSGVESAVGAGGSDGVTGTTTVEMKDIDTFTDAGWNIDDAGASGTTWRIYDGYTYPLLRTFLMPATVESVEDDSKIYDGEEYNGGDGYVITEEVDHDLIYYGGTAQGAVNAGSYSLSIYSAQQGYNLVDERTAELTIEKRELTVSVAEAQDKIYDGSDSAIVNFDGVELQDVVGNDGVELDSSGCSATFAQADVGNHEVTVADLDLSGEDAGNYSLTQPTLSADITPGELTITADDKSKIYGADDPEFTVIYDGFIGGEDESDLGGGLEFEREEGEETGEYAIIPSGATSENYDISFHEGILTIVSAIQDEIDEAIADPDIETLELEAGTYYGDIVIPEHGDGLTLVSSEYREAIIHAECKDVAITILADNVTVEGFKITGFREAGVRVRGRNARVIDTLIDGYYCDPAQEATMSGIQIFESRARVQHNDIEDVEIGVGIGDGGDFARILNNSITRNTVAGIMNITGSSPKYARALHNNIFYKEDEAGSGIIWDAEDNPILATNNWWGDESGPFHEEKNPDGQGDSISDNVEIEESWIGEESEGSGAVANGDESEADDPEQGVGVKIKTTGGGEVSVSAVKDNPTGVLFDSDDESTTYTQVDISDRETEGDKDNISEVVLIFHYREPSGKVVYWLDDNNRWVACSDQEVFNEPLPDYDDYDGYVRITTNEKTSPSLTKHFSGRTFVIGTAEQTLDRVSGSSSDCFIATVAFGSPNSPAVQVLRSFRDRFLLTSRAGTTMVELYYACSPPLAAFIEHRPVLHTLTAMALLPVCGAAYLLVSGYALPFALLLTTVIMCIFLAIKWRERLMSAKLFLLATALVLGGASVSHGANVNFFEIAPGEEKTVTTPTAYTVGEGAVAFDLFYSVHQD